jgi:hypothetical protein
MSNIALSKGLNPMQQAFLMALVGEAKGNMELARDLAGYSPNTKIVDIVRPLKDQLADLAREALINHSLKAAFAMIDVMDRPAEMGAANKLKAATEILNRVGVTPPDENTDKGPKSAIIFLPPKNVASIKVDNIEITMTDSDGPLTISPEDPENPEES